MNKNVTFGEYLRNLRESLNYPIRVVAAHVDIDPSTLSKIERDERKATLDLLEPLSEILEVNFDNLRVHFLSDQIAKTLKSEENPSIILKLAEGKVKYIKQSHYKQNKFDFNE